ncbi:nuclear transport factor 2 family protein [Labilithrix luteola]|nr:nuclear transport factor 2 family protein [Labilithrix luteola]
METHPKALTHEEAANYVARFAERWNPLQPAALGDLMHEDTQNRIPPMTSPADRVGVIAHFEGTKKLLPDLRLVPTRWAANGDALFIEWRAEATVKGQTLTWTGVDRVQLRDGKTYAAEAYWDTRRVAELVAAAMR